MARSATVTPADEAEAVAAGGLPGRLHAHVWSNGQLSDFDRLDERFRDAWASEDAIVWVDLESPTAELLAELAQSLELHPLIVEDIAERNQRAKIEATGEVLHIVMFALLYEGELVPAELDIVLGRRFLLTAHPPEFQPTETGHFRRSGVAPFLAKGPDYVLWAVVDGLVDGYFPVFDKLGDEIDELQEDVLGRPSRWLIERLLQVRKDLLTIRHAINPQREIFNQLTNREMVLVKPDRVIYFRDVYDHLIRLTDELDSYREIVGTTLDAYLSTVNNNLSEVMKRLTAATVVLAGVGALAGIFGMSEAGLALDFAEAPGFWVVTVAILVIGGAGLLYFRRIGWL
ncbi:MAG: magnesium transporter CorA family protein [Chloroflexi bacterium]|nr:magnesium transporter CorA family protein [Chloroflexota bacterium]